MKTYSDKSFTKGTKLPVFVTAIVFVCVIVVGPFVSPVFGSALRTVFKPVITFTNSIGTGIASLGSYFSSKKNLTKENEQLKNRVTEVEALLLDRETLAAENTTLKESLGRSVSKKLVLAKVLIKPNRSLYDTLIIDIGANAQIKEGAKVFAYGNIPIGVITSVDNGTSVVKLYSTAGEKTFGRIDGSHIDIELTGRGGGNFEAELPRDVTVLEGTNVLLPDISAHIIARVGKELSDPRDPVQKFLLTSPVNMSELDFVEVEG